MSHAHDSLVVAQFGPRARAYVESADHSKGADLAALTAIAAADPGRRVLDLGCGGGHVSYTVAPYAAEVTAFDLSEEMLAAVRETARKRGFDNIRTRQGRAEALPFDSASFDLVCTRFSAHHWHDLAVGLAEMRRVLRPGGRAVVMDAISPGPARFDTFLQAVELLRDPSHVRDYSAAEWVAVLRGAGFKPATPSCGRLRLDFARWVERIGTPDVQVKAIRALQRHAAADVVEAFAIEADGSFQLDTMIIEAEIDDA